MVDVCWYPVASGRRRSFCQLLGVVWSDLRKIAHQLRIGSQVAFGSYVLEPAMRGRRNEVPVRGEPIAGHVAVEVAPEYAVLVERQLADGGAEFFEIETGVGTAHRIEGPDGRSMTRPQRFIALEQLEMPTKIARAPLLLTDTEHVGDEGAGATPSRDDESKPAVGVEPQLVAI